MYKQEIPVFFAVDDAYIPFLAVTMQSLIENASNENLYVLRVLYTNISDENINKIMKYAKDNIKIEFVNVQEKLEKLKNKLLVRDYYSNATYFRILLPNLYPEYDKVIYLDSDIVILEDIANLYNIDLSNNLLAGVPEPWFEQYEEFQTYAERIIGVSSYKKYINVGVLLMNLKELRNMNFEDVFMHLLDVVKYTFLQDEDYINRICKGRIKHIDERWNVSGYLYDKENPKIVHYTIFKPWHREEMLNKDCFWKYAKNTEFYDYIKGLITEQSAENEVKSLKEFRRIAEFEASCVGNG